VRPPYVDLDAAAPSQLWDLVFLVRRALAPAVCRRLRAACRCALAIGSHHIGDYEAGPQAHQARALLLALDCGREDAVGLVEAVDPTPLSANGARSNARTILFSAILLYTEPSDLDVSSLVL
jgi:hypothetical protein